VGEGGGEEGEFGIGGRAYWVVTPWGWTFPETSLYTCLLHILHWFTSIAFIL
jgi:hypothetical protein